MSQAVSSLQSDDHFEITPSDTVAVKDDPNNTENYEFVYLHNASAVGGQVRVLSGAGKEGLMYLNPGQTGDLKVKQVFATAPVPPSDLYGRVGFKGY